LKDKKYNKYLVQDSICFYNGTRYFLTVTAYTINIIISNEKTELLQNYVTVTPLSELHPIRK